MLFLECEQYAFMEVLTEERGAQTRQRLGWEYVWGGHWGWWWGGCRYQEEERAVFGVDEGDLGGASDGLAVGLPVRTIHSQLLSTYFMLGTVLGAELRQ